MATIITSHIATKRPALPAHVSPGIAIQTIARVQPPGMAIPPAMERDQWTVAAALARNSSAPAARSDSVLVAVVVAHPALYVIGIFVAALGQQVEHVVGAVQRLDAASVARIRVEHCAGPILVEHARALAIGHPRVRRPDIVEQGVALDLVEGGARHGHEADVAVGQVQAGAVVMVGPEGAAWASFLVLRSEHEMIDEQLALRAEQLGEGLFAVRSLEHVRLVDPLPGERAAQPAHLVLGTGELLFFREQLGAGGDPAVVGDHGMVAQVIRCHAVPRRDGSGAGARNVGYSTNRLNNKQPMPQTRSRRLDQVYGAIASPTRRAILTALAGGEVNVGRLARRFPVSFNAVSKHVKVLERAGLVSRRVRGREHWLRLRAEPLREAARWLARQRVFWDARLDALEVLLRDDAGG